MRELGQIRANERGHGEFLDRQGAEEVWGWASAAGQRRARRRAGFFVQELSGGRRALELGCGTGLFTRLVAERSAAEITAIDLSAPLLRQARSRTAAGHVTYLLADAHALPFPDASFGVVYGSSVLHHLLLERVLPELLRVLAPGGALVFAEPNLLNPQIWAERKLPAVRRATGTSPDETAFVRFQLERTLRAQGFVGVAITPHEFLHPATPAALIPLVTRLTALLERAPGVRELAGSLLIRAHKASGE